MEANFNCYFEKQPKGPGGTSAHNSKSGTGHRDICFFRFVHRLDMRCVHFFDREPLELQAKDGVSSPPWMKKSVGTIVNFWTIAALEGVHSPLAIQIKQKKNKRQN